MIREIDLSHLENTQSPTHCGCNDRKRIHDYAKRQNSPGKEQESNVQVKAWIAIYLPDAGPAQCSSF